VNYTLSFSHIQNDIRVPLVLDGREVTLTVEAENKIATYGDPEVIKLCNEHQASVRAVNK
jgi:hypothetical protein